MIGIIFLAIGVASLLVWVLIEFLPAGYNKEAYSYYHDKVYRIKEFNKAYDPWFGKGKGWIYCTNFITKAEADRLIKRNKWKTDHVIEKQINVQLHPRTKNGRCIVQITNKR